MTMRFHVVHRTRYSYGLPMADGFTRAYLLPRDTPSQVVRSASVRIVPEPDELEELVDVFGNRIVQFAVHRAHEVLVVEAECEVEVTPNEHPEAGPAWDDVARAAAALMGDLAIEVGAFLAVSPLAPELPQLSELTTPSFPPGRPVVEAVRAFCHSIWSTFQYDAGFTDVTTPLATVLAARRGVCQDFAHVAVAALRSIGLPARYVSGYIETEPPPGEPKLAGVDASHAWCSVWIGPHGWLEFDPTNDELPPRHHVVVGWGRDYGDVTPVRGVVIGPAAMQELGVAVDVTRVA